MTDLDDSKYRRYLLLVWLAFSALILFVARDVVANWKVGDPDDQLRIVQTRDWLAGQSWFDVSQYRMNVPEGAPMHWSRLVDIPLGIVMLITKPMFGQAVSEQIAGASVPLLTFGFVLFLVAEICRRLSDNISGIFAAGLVATSIPVITQLRPMRVDHHGWQMVLFLISVLMLLKSENYKKFSPVMIGIAAAIWMNISIEGLVYAVIFIGILGLRWSFSHQQTSSVRAELITGMASLAAASFLLFLVTNGLHDLKNYSDAISPVHIVSLAVIASILPILTLLSDRLTTNLTQFPRTFVRLAALGLSAVSGGALIVIFAPQSLQDTFTNLDPLVQEYWYSRVNEGLPVWDQLIPDMAQLLICFFVALIAMLIYLKSHPPKLINQSGELVILTLCTILMGMLVARTAAYAILLSFVFIAPLVASLWQKAEQGQSISFRMGLRVLAMILAVPSVTVSLALRPFEQQVNIAPEKMIQSAADCAKMSNIKALKSLPTSNLLAPLDSGPAILLHTGHNIVASGHHRNQKAMKDVIRAFTGSNKVAHSIIKRRKIDYIVACPAAYEMMLYRYRPKDSFWSQLMAGKNPDWLIPQKQLGVYHVWRVK